MIRNFVFFFVFLGIFGCGDGSEKVRFDKPSNFERVFVVDRGDYRYLRFGSPDGANQSIVSLSNPGSVPSRYIRIAVLAVVLTPKLDRMLMLGLGGGTYATLLHRHLPELAIDAVEIDPVVVEAAKGLFGVKEDLRLRIHVQDGAKFIRNADRLYDLVFLDAYSGKGLPRDLSSPAFFYAVRAKVADEGVVVLNLFKQRGREQSLLDMFQARFPHTACIRTSDDLNLVVFGKTAAMPSRAELTAAARRFAEASRLPFDLGIIAEDLKLNCTGPARANPP
jgi:spermidine synthase